MNVVKTKPQIVAEILPNRTRIAASEGTSVVAGLISLYYLNNFFTDDLLRKIFQTSSEAFNKLGVSILLPLISCVLLWGILRSLWRLIFSLLIYPSPRIRITENGFELIHLWRTQVVEWSAFRRFTVGKTDKGDDGAVCIKILGAICGTGGEENEILSFKLYPFVPPLRSNFDEGKRLTQWILDARGGGGTLPPDSLNVRMPKNAMVTAAGARTVARR